MSWHCGGVTLSLSLSVFYSCALRRLRDREIRKGKKNRKRKSRQYDGARAFLRCRGGNSFTFPFCFSFSRIKANRGTGKSERERKTERERVTTLEASDCLIMQSAIKLTNLALILQTYCCFFLFYNSGILGCRSGKLVTVVR